MKNPEIENLYRWCQGDEAAVRMLVSLGEVSQIADDFVDGDKPGCDSAAMSRLLLLALVNLPNNPFFEKYRAWLAPLLASALLQWDASNGWHRDPRRDTRIYGFVYRCALEKVIVTTAYLIAGFEHARNVEREVHEFYRYSADADGETFEQWEAIT